MTVSREQGSRELLVSAGSMVLKVAERKALVRGKVLAEDYKKSDFENSFKRMTLPQIRTTSLLTILVRIIRLEDTQTATYFSDLQFPALRTLRSGLSEVSQSHPESYFLQLTLLTTFNTFLCLF